MSSREVFLKSKKAKYRSRLEEHQLTDSITHEPLLPDFVLTQKGCVNRQTLTSHWKYQLQHNKTQQDLTCPVTQDKFNETSLAQNTLPQIPLIKLYHEIKADEKVLSKKIEAVATDSDCAVVEKLFQTYIKNTQKFNEKSNVVQASKKASQEVGEVRRKKSTWQQLKNLISWKSDNQLMSPNRHVSKPLFAKPSQQRSQSASQLVHRTPSI